MPKQLNPSEIEQFLKEPHVAVLTTIAAHGRPVSTPIWYLYSDGRFYMRTSEDSAKARNIRRDQRVGLCVQQERAPYKFVAVRGTATLESERPELAVAMARRYLGLIGGSFYLRGARQDVEGSREVTLVVTPDSFRSEDYSPETPLVGRFWLALKRLLPQWL